jgi:hypothetical protein
VRLPNDTSTCCDGCQGGLMDDAFSYLVSSQHGAIDTEAAYPYTGRSGSCSFDAAHSGATVGGWTDVPQGDEAALLDAVATVGPVSIAVDASIGWQLCARAAGSNAHTTSAGSTWWRRALPPALGPH